MQSGPARAAVFAACCDCVNLLTLSGVLDSTHQGRAKTCRNCRGSNGSVLGRAFSPFRRRLVSSASPPSTLGDCPCNTIRGLQRRLRGHCGNCWRDATQIRRPRDELTSLIDPPHVVLHESGEVAFAVPDVYLYVTRAADRRASIAVRCSSTTRW